MKNIVINWFRQDLRISDNPSLYSAAQEGIVLPVYILDTINAKQFAMGLASKCWLHQSLTSLNNSLNGKLQVYVGDPIEVLKNLQSKYKANKIYWNRCYEPWRTARDKQIKQYFQQINVDIRSFNGSLLWEPWEVLKEDKTPYKIFTPYSKKCQLNNMLPREPKSFPNNITLVKENPTTINDLKLIKPNNWSQKVLENWDIGEQPAQKQLRNFLEQKLQHYKDGRNFLDKDYTSRLSPYLHFGEISPNQIWYAAHNCKNNENLGSFITELIWREFSYNLLYHFPNIIYKNFKEKFDNFAWENNDKYIKTWQSGLTGYPIIDAAMQELWQTGYMHNRARMLVGSFLVKNLLVDWRYGANWFWDCLFDADLANNYVSWQWVAGCGTDAAPYFRIFNPIIQGKKFDPNGIYIKKYLPILKHLPIKYIFTPWLAPEYKLKEAGIRLGTNYPLPIVDIEHSRKKALALYKCYNLD
jgi:deoxyribodipyrimidine photo-lyase